MESNMFIQKELKNVEAVPQKAGRGVSMRMLLSSDEAPNFAMRNFIIEAGGFMPLHTNSVEHEQYVLSGRAKVQVGSEFVEASAGDVLLIPAGLEHSYEVIGDEAYSFLCLVPNKEDTIRVI